MKVSFQGLYKIPLAKLSKLSRAERNALCKKASPYLNKPYFMVSNKHILADVKNSCEKKFTTICKKLFNITTKKAD